MVFWLKMFISTCENNLSENLVLYFLHFVLSEPCGKTGSYSDISEVSMVLLLVNFQRSDNILGINEEDWINKVNNWKYGNNVSILIFANWG